MKREYIYLFCSFLIYFSGIGQVVPYTLEWTTNIPKIGYSGGNRHVNFAADGLIYLDFIKYGGASASAFDFDPWLTPNAYADQPWSESNQNFLLVLDTDQNIHYGSYLDRLGASTSSTVVSETGNFYAFGTTKITESIATSGAHQETFSGHIGTVTIGGISYETLLDDGYLIRHNEQGQKEWGTYFNGTNGATDIRSLVERNNIIYIGGATSSTEGFATANAPLTTMLPNTDSDSFLAAFDLDGTLLWCTYTHQKFSDSTGRLLLMDSKNDIYERRQRAFPAETAYTFSKFNNQGVWLEDLTAPLHFTQMFLSPDDKFYFTGYTTSNEGIATPGAYKTIKTFDTEHFVVCYDLDMNKLWGTYLGERYNFIYSAGGAHILETTFDNNYHITIALPLDTPGLASEGAYQSEINGLNDFLILSLNESGALNWSTYFGGNMEEIFIRELRYDNNDNLYLYGGSNSHDMATEGAFLETPYIDENTGLNNFFLSKFVPNPDASVEKPETVRFQVYPNPATDLLQIRSGTLDTTITAVEVYDLSGKRVLQPALQAQQQQSIDVSALASGVYLLKIHSSDQMQNVQFVKR